MSYPRNGISLTCTQISIYLHLYDRTELCIRLQGYTRTRQSDSEVFIREAHSIADRVCRNDTTLRANVFCLKTVVYIRSTKVRM